MKSNLFNLELSCRKTEVASVSVFPLFFSESVHQNNQEIKLNPIVRSYTRINKHKKESRMPRIPAKSSIPSLGPVGCCSFHSTGAVEQHSCINDFLDNQTKIGGKLLHASSNLAPVNEVLFHRPAHWGKTK